MQQTLQTLFQYKAWAHEQLHALLAVHLSSLSAQDQTTVLRLLNHVWVVEQIFQANLQGLPHGWAALNTTDTPTLATLLTRQQDSDRWFQHYLHTLDNTDLAQQLDFCFVDGQAGSMQRDQMLMHLLTHGNYHRGMVGNVLARAGIQPPKDSLTVFLHRHT
ncbi:DinB family protein [Paludibacterium sp. B53371]|uniref:DinB family protein n=1 Tax=Paludibacterium sp. B53371 TaxID=2806263 RepID=UPI001C03C583|nr:DinB family protein [Paludibacterium sp. B53371]